MKPERALGKTEHATYRSRRMDQYFSQGRDNISKERPDFVDEFKRHMACQIEFQMF